MKRLLIWKVTIAVLAFSLYILSDIRAQNGKIDPPNIIFIMADDLGYGDLSCYGQQYFETPNIDRLAQEGIRFTQAYAGASVCTPSRSVLMTGLHNGHTPARDNIPHYATYLEEDDVTVAEVLQGAGYRTGGVGKWSLGDAGTVGRATNQGFDFWLGYLNQDHAHYYYTEYLDLNDDTLMLAGNTYTRDNYSHDILTNGALQFIRSNRRHPFFLYAAYTVPHFSSRSEDEHRMPVPKIDPRFQDKDWPMDAKKYATMIRKLDQDVGRILELVRELGLDDHTLVIFTSDNGGNDTVWKEFKTNGAFRGYKRDLTEGGIRVPFIARWPGKIPAHSTSDELISFQDMMPTFAQLAGTAIPDNIDGVSVVDALMGNPLETPHQYLYWDYGHNRDRYDQAIRLGKWKGIRHGVGNDLELYDLSQDPGEANNVADQHPDVVARIDALMKESYTPNDRYRIGEIYTGSKLWRKTTLNHR